MSYLEVLQKLVKLAINDLASIDVTVQHFQLLVGEPIRRPLRVIQAIAKFGLQQQTNAS